MLLTKRSPFGSLFKLLPGSALFFFFNIYQGFISVTERRVSKLKSSIDLLRKDDCKIFKVRDVASVVGQVISLTPCVGGVARIMTRALYTFLSYGNLRLS